MNIVSASIAALIIDAIQRGVAVTILYRKPNGVLNVRAIKPYAIERCRVNGNTIVRAICVHAESEGKQAVRSFTFDSMLDCAQGNTVSAQNVLRRRA